MYRKLQVYQIILQLIREITLPILPVNVLEFNKEEIYIGNIYLKYIIKRQYRVQVTLFIISVHDFQKR